MHEEAGELLADVFRSEGIELRFGVAVEAVEPGVVLRLSDGSTVEAKRLLVATGRRPNTEDLGLEQLGVTIGPRGIAVDERLRAAENVWAIGDGRAGSCRRRRASPPTRSHSATASSVSSPTPPSACSPARSRSARRPRSGSAS